MQIRIVSVGKVRQKFVLEGEAEYVKRVGKDVRIIFDAIGSSSPESMPVDETMTREAALVLRKIDGADYIIVLDENGKMSDSPQMGKSLAKHMQLGTKEIVYVIGGAFGLHQTVKEVAHETLSLSKMTFPHQLVRLMLVEQLYRAYALVKHIPYHK